MNTLAQFILSNQSEAVREAVRSIVQRLRWPALLVGGAVRDALFKRPLSDLDIIVQGATTMELREAFHDDLRSLTDFGGLRLAVNDVPVDMWPLHETWAFRENRWSTSPSFSEYVKTTSFTFEAIGITLHGPIEIHDGGFADAVQRKVLELNLDQNPFPFLLSARAAVLSKRFDLTMGARLARYITDHAPTVPKLMAAQLHKYKRTEVSEEEMQKFLDHAKAITDAVAAPTF